jgi:hypothetical protein
VSRIVGFLAKQILRKYASLLPDLSGLLRPCIIKMFRRYYAVLDFDIGCPNVDWRRQIRVAVHEAQHKFDIASYVKEFKVRATNWYRNYFTDSTFRAAFEGYPNTAEAEVMFYLTGEYPSPVCDFDAYLIFDARAKAAFKQGCAMRKKEIMELGRGNASQEAAKHAIEILKELGIGG